MAKNILKDLILPAPAWPYKIPKLNVKRTRVQRVRDVRKVMRCKKFSSF